VESLTKCLKIYAFSQATLCVVEFPVIYCLTWCKVSHLHTAMINRLR